MDDIWHLTLFKIQESPVNLIKILLFIAIIILSYLLGTLIRRAISKAFSLRNYSPSSSYAISRLAYFFVVIMGFYCALTTLGIDLTGIAVIAGALTVGIGFGLQAIISNFVSGLLILFEKAIIPGDMIQLDSGMMGKVLKINIRSTVIQTTDHRRILIPNTEMISKKLIHLSDEKRESFQWKIFFTVARESKKEKVKKAILTMAIPKEIPIEESHLHLVLMTEASQEWELILWLDVRKEKMFSSLFLTLSQEIEVTMQNEGITLGRVSSSCSLGF